MALVAHGIHDSGGMERACAELIRYTSNRFRFITITAELDPELRPLVDRWIRIGVPRRPIPVKFVMFFVRAALALRQVDVDLVHTVGAIIPSRADVAAVHYCHAGAQQAFGSLASGRPLLRQVNTSLDRRIALTAEAWCYRPSRVKCFAPVSYGLAAELNRFYPRIPSVVVANGVDTARFRPDRTVRQRVRRHEGLYEQDFVTLFVGGDWYRKGLAIAIEAVASVNASGTPAWLWVVGKGDEPRFADLARAAGLPDRIRFFGHDPVPHRFFQAADVFVMPTTYETFSLVSYEAAACGLPVVATRVSGVAELIGNDEAGILVHRDSGTVADALKRLAASPGLRLNLGAHGRRRVALLGWDESAEAMIRLYDTLL